MRSAPRPSARRPAPKTEQGITSGDATTEKLLSHAGYDTHHYGKWHLDGGDLPHYAGLFGEHRDYAREMAAVFEGVRRRPRETWMNWYGWALPVEISPPTARPCVAFATPPDRRRSW